MRTSGFWSGGAREPVVDGFAQTFVRDCHYRDVPRAGSVERAHDLFDAYLPLARYEQQPGFGLAIRKYTLAKRGAIGSAALRKPGGALSKADIADIERLIARQEQRLKEIG